MNPLIKKLKTYGEISLQVEAELESKITTHHKKKYSHLLKAGQIVASLFVIEQGLIRAYFTKDGKEINSWFCIENMIAGSILPLYMGKPSFENIEFLEDSIIHSISSHDLNQIYRNHPEMNAIGRKVAEKLCLILEERITSLHTEDAQQRYLSLMRDYPNLNQRINLGHIATYLGITQETLSRIRKR